MSVHPFKVLNLSLDLLLDYLGVQVLRYGYDSMRMRPENQGLMICEDVPTVKASRERLSEIAFESLCVPSVYLSKQPVLQLYSTGRTSGVVCSSGYTMSHVVPIHEGYMLDHAAISKCVGGMDVSHYLLQNLQRGGHCDAAKKWSLDNFLHCSFLDEIKHKYCFVPTKLNKEYTSTNSVQSHTLPDGSELKLDPEICAVGELLFQPFEDSREPTDVFHNGLDLAVNTHEAVTRCNSLRQRDRKEMFNNIVLAGGNTLFPGVKERFVKELQSLVPQMFSSSVTVTAAYGGQMSAWNGGAFLASLSTFEGLSLLRKEYEEHGSQIVHKKFP